jgi:hypothetical protein
MHFVGFDDGKGQRANTAKKVVNLLVFLWACLNAPNHPRKCISLRSLREQRLAEEKKKHLKFPLTLGASMPGMEENHAPHQHQRLIAFHS